MTLHKEMICEVDVWPTLALMEVAHILTSVASPSLNRNDVYPVHQTNLKLNKKTGNTAKKDKGLCPTMDWAYTNYLENTSENYSFREYFVLLHFLY